MAVKKPSNKKRRLKGTGGRFWSNKLGRYVARAIVGRYANGKLKYTQCSAKTTTEAENAISQAVPKAEGMTLAVWLEKWLREMKCKPGTRRGRTSAVKFHIAPTLGHLLVAEITPRQIEVAASTWELHPNSACNTVGILGTAMRAAVRAGLRSDNPVRAAHKPKKVKKKIDPYTLEEIELIVKEAASRPNTRIIAVLAVSGMRVGEALALDIPDVVDITVSITKTLDNTDRNLRGSPKSQNSIRTIEMPTDPAEALAALRAACGNRASGPVFRTASGKRSVYKVLYKANQTLLKRLGLRYRGVHQLRHSVASHQLTAGVPITEIAKYLGDTPAEVLKTYSHATGQVNAAATFAGLFKGRQSDNRVTNNSATPVKPRKSKSKTAK